jgi:hypothetical protein
MEDDETKRGKSDTGSKDWPRPDQIWAERFVQPVKFRRFTGSGRSGKPLIFIQFDLPPGQDQLAPNVYAILKELKHLDRSSERGEGLCPTGLKSESSARHKSGTLWSLPDNPVGRTACDILWAKLIDLAGHMESEQEKGR